VRVAVDRLYRTGLAQQRTETSWPFG
jgi:hypothetical protein